MIPLHPKIALLFKDTVPAYNKDCKESEGICVSAQGDNSALTFDVEWGWKS